MIPNDMLIELFGIATSPSGSHGQFRTVQPSTESVKRIERELGIAIPPDFVGIASSCPSYVSWLASIGEDYDHPNHILRLNEAFHDPEDPPALPQHFVLLNHGYDGDCDCWDTRTLAVSGEHPIVFVNLDSDAMQTKGRKFESFGSYIEDFVRYHAPRAADRSRRRRAQSLLAMCGA